MEWILEEICCEDGRLMELTWDLVRRMTFLLEGFSVECRRDSHLCGDVSCQIVNNMRILRSICVG